MAITHDRETGTQIPASERPAAVEHDSFLHKTWFKATAGATALALSFGIGVAATRGGNSSETAPQPATPATAPQVPGPAVGGEATPTTTETTAASPETTTPEVNVGIEIFNPANGETLDTSQPNWLENFYGSMVDDDYWPRLEAARSSYPEPTPLSTREISSLEDAQNLMDILSLNVTGALTTGDSSYYAIYIRNFDSPNNRLAADLTSELNQYNEDFPRFLMGRHQTEVIDYVLSVDGNRLEIDYDASFEIYADPRAKKIDTYEDRYAELVWDHELGSWVVP